MYTHTVCTCKYLCSLLFICTFEGWCYCKKKNAFTSNTVGFLLQYYFLWLIFIFTVVIFQLYYLLVTFYNIGGDTSERSDRFSSSRSLSFLWSVSPPKPPAVSTLHFLPLWTDRKREPETHSNTTGGHVHRNEWHPDMLQYVSAFAMSKLQKSPKNETILNNKIDFV